MAVSAAPNAALWAVAAVNTVDAARNTRSAKRTAVEQALSQAIGMAMVVYPTNPDSCKTLFDFTLLYPAHHQHIYNETLAGNAIATVVKHKFGGTAQIKITTTTDTKVLVYLSTAKDATDSTAIDVAGNSSRTIDCSEFEVDLNTHRFVVIQNTVAETVDVKVEI